MPNNPFISEIKEFLRFTKSERRAFVVLLGLVIVVFLLPSIFPYIFPPDESVIDNLPVATETRNDSAWGNYAANSSERDWRRPATENNGNTLQPFPFDPNTVTAAQLQQMGLSARTAETWMKFRGSGFRFRSPNDIRRIFGLRPQEVETLLGYVEIAPVGETRNFGFSTASSHSEFERPTLPATERRFERAPRVIEKVDINQSDTSDWMALPGIGRYYAGRIVNFREKLGGFHSIAQVAETYNLPDSTFQKILPYLKMGEKGITRLNINTASRDELNAHPYISRPEADAIFNYRQQHGSFGKLDDLRKIHLLNHDWMLKLEPYLSID